MHFKLSHVTVYFSLPPEPSRPSFEFHDVAVRCDVQEAFHLLMCNAFVGHITKLIPEYELVPGELPEVPQKED